VTLLVLPAQAWLCLVLVGVLGWGGQRLRGREALAQMYAVMVLLAAATYVSLGPFAALSADPAFTEDEAGRILAGFAIACSVMVVSQVLRAGEQIEATSVAAAERDSLQRILAATTGVAIIEAGQDGRISMFNVGAERLLGYDAADVVGTPLADLLPPASQSALARRLSVPADWLAIAGALAPPDRVGTEVELVGADGTLRTHAMTLARVTDERGDPRGFLSTSEDVTDQVASRQALEDLVQRLREVDEIKDSFVATVSHELRTPLTSILGYVELLEDSAFGALGESQRRAVGKISDNSDRLLQLIEDLLSLSQVRVDSVYGKGGDTVVDLRDVVLGARAALSPKACRPGLAIAVDVGLVPALVMGNPARLKQAVLNLLTNGVKFTPGPGDGDVGICLRREGPEHVISVADSGIGIPASEQEHLFTRFFRGAESDGRAIQGSGLGLSLVREIVEGHLGTVHVQSSPGHGSRFEVRLPVLSSVDDQELVERGAAGTVGTVG
ncbi:PAS domain-containing sensor histidine kinase, partial [Nocardioides psychrotolerans]|uniref:sensor histidine kinase n=1 Tax=Nocardioides psychrotolerans TaxID=1005945 RepID=UPI0031383F45